ncbi:MAG: hypothetical protein K8I27_08720 [Planctomycetes bacterium]|nr:hypothetical protein [Planctomycetota bacterium]
MRYLRFSLLCFVLLVPFCVTTAQDAPAPDQPSFSDAEIDLAEKVVSALTPEQQILINGLRYLMRPDYEAEVMGKRKFRPSVLPPFETIPAEPMTRLEMLRLWAVLQSGLPVSPSMKVHVGRFLETPMLPESSNYAPAGVAMGVCLEIARRDELGRAEDAKAKAADIMKALMDLRDLTDEKSPLTLGGKAPARWFAAHLWRYLSCRVALELGIEFNERVWEGDIRALAGAYDKHKGWSTTGKGAKDVSGDLNANLIGMACVALVTQAPPEAISSGVLRTLDKRVKYIPEQLSRLDKDYQFQRLVGGRLLMTRSFDPQWTPERVSAETWRQDVMRHAAAYEATGAVKDFDAGADDLALVSAGDGRFDVIAMETCLSCLAAGGGVFRAANTEYALASLTLPEIGRAMHAFSVLHAHRVPPDSDGFSGPIRGAEEAIKLGCEWLDGLQKKNGSFPGQSEMYSGNTAICLLALLHGGWRRDSQVIQRGLDWLVDYNPGKTQRGREVAGVGYRNTYSDALVLMLLQKYYEREQRASGMFLAATPKEFEDARKEVWKEVSDKHRKLIDWSVKNLDEAHCDKGWGYYPGNVPYPDGMAGNFAGYADNSCSQYAMLGYKAASLLGAKTGTALLVAEANRLIGDYSPAGGTPVEYLHRPDEKTGDEKKQTIVPGGWGYAGKGGASLQMTAAGISSLVIAQDELKVRGELKDDLAAKIGLTIHGAQTWLATCYYKPGADGTVIDKAFEASWSDGWSIYYNLYSVERACELASLATLGSEVDWYEIGAEALIRNQTSTGGWGLTSDARSAALGGQPQVINTSMAILFLKRASMPVITDPKRRAKEGEEKPPEPKPDSPVTGK